MINWLISQMSTIIVLLLLAAIVAAIISSMIKDRRNGRSSCGCNCGSCPMHDKCHSTAGQRVQKGT